MEVLCRCGWIHGTVLIVNFLKDNLIPFIHPFLLFFAYNFVWINLVLRSIILSRSLTVSTVCPGLGRLWMENVPVDFGCCRTKCQMISIQRYVGFMNRKGWVRNLKHEEPIESIVLKVAFLYFCILKILGPVVQWIE